MTSLLCQTPSIHMFLLWNSIRDKASSESLCLYYVYTHTHTHTHSFYTSFINRHALEARCSYKNWGHGCTGNDTDPNFCSPKVHILEGEVDKEGGRCCRGLPAPSKWEEAIRGTHKLLAPEASGLLGHAQKSREPLMLWGLGSTFQGGPQGLFLPPGLKTSPFVFSSWPVPPSPSHTRVQFSSVAQSCPTLCNPMNRSTPGLPVHHQLPEFTQTHVH